MPTLIANRILGVSVSGCAGQPLSLSSPVPPAVDDPRAIVGLDGKPLCWCCGERPPIWDGRYCSRRCRYTASQLSDPTPDEIRQGCEEIRAGWSEQERWNRAYRPEILGWDVPTMAVADVTAAHVDAIGL
jgi:hypothetical protein